MKIFKATARIILFVLSGFLLFFSAGCDKYTQYKILTFFFTGVPHPDEPQETASLKKQKILASQKNKKERKQRTLSQSSLAVEHGPFGSGQCNLCHQTVAKKGKEKVDKTKPLSAIPSWESALPGKLVLPLKELCTDCHVNKSVKSAYSKDLWIHGPVSDGLCNACHSPHQSPFKYMLLMEKSIDLCSKCHAKGFIVETEDHKQGKECISCHNSHLGKNRFLLKEDFDEAY